MFTRAFPRFALTAALLLGTTAMTQAADPAPDAKAAAPKAAAAKAESSFTPAQRKEFGELVREYLLKNPQVIEEAVAALQDNKEAAREAERKTVLKSRDKELMNPAEGTVLGNPKGDVTIVEFFDYNCGYCKQTFSTVMDTVKNDGKIKLVLKEFPILGPSSITASKAALAAVKQGKYKELHVAMFSHKGSLTDEIIMQLARDVGLDIPKLQSDMKADSVDKVIKDNHDLARALDINGTPAFLIGSAFAPGALKKEQIDELVTQARKKS